MLSRVSFRTGLSEAALSRVFGRAPCTLDIAREDDCDEKGFVSYVWTLDFGDGVFVVRQGGGGVIFFCTGWVGTS